MQEMKKGDYAFFYHSNCKTPGVVGVMEIVQESSVDGSCLHPLLHAFTSNQWSTTESAFDTAHPYYDAKSKREDPKWVVVHVEYRRKLGKQVTLAELKSNAQPGRPLENMQMLKQSRLSISSVTPAQWQYILELAGEEPQEEFTKVESGAEKA
jgi:predicted RNA-binding protein with PUA-like domain